MPGVAARDKSISASDSVFLPPDEFYEQLAGVCTRRAVTVDLFAVSVKPIGLNCIGLPSRRTNGDCLVLPGDLPPAMNGMLDVLASAITRSLTRVTGHAATLRLRCSQCLSVG